MNKIISKERFSEKVFKLEIEAPLIAKSRKAGHFVIVRVGDKGERMPLTIAGSDLKKGTITLVIQEVGLSSTRLCELNEGDYITDVVGPLGQATHIENFGTVVCAGGGVGVAPMLPIVQALKAAGNRVITVLAGRNKDLIILEKEMRESSDEVIIMTDDGSYGRKGLVTEGVEEVIKREKVDKCFAIGPAIMMKFVCKLTKELEILKAMYAHLEEGKLARSYETEDEDELAFIATLNLLTWKPVIFAANVAEDDLSDDGASNEYVQAVRNFAAENGSEVFVICAQIEQEIAELDDDEKKMFLEDLGLTESGLDKLIAASYRLLGLISYLTAGETETRAWTIKVGTKAPQAAGKIHSDFERGFIKAEVVNYQDLLDCGSYAGAREKGLVRMEGKDYIVRDGDVILFRFNV